MCISFRQILLGALSPVQLSQNKQAIKQQFGIKFKTTQQSCLNISLINRGCQSTIEDDQNLLWDNQLTQKQLAEILKKHKNNTSYKVNHFVGSNHLRQVSYLYSKLELFKSKNSNHLSRHNTYMPLTYLLPRDKKTFISQMKNKKHQKWIFKDIKGRYKSPIYSEHDQILKAIQDHNSDGLIQQFISNILFIGGKAFDIRIYVLVTSYDPLTVYIHKQGFVFFNEQYINHPSGVENQIKHLTGYSIEYLKQQMQRPKRWTLNNLKLWMISKFNKQKTNQCFVQIQKTVFATISSVKDSISPNKNCFELYGFNFILDEELKPWLLNITNTPSLTAYTQEVKNMKCNMIDDIMTLLNLNNKMPQRYNQSIGGFQILTQQKITKQNYESCIGGNQNRAHELKKIVKQTLCELRKMQKHFKIQEKK